MQQVDYKKEIMKLLEQMNDDLLRFAYNLLRGMSDQ